ncbi:internalin_A [Hexamita inflata]|uniref:Internalin A n=1 Tax=Hexamita inflata TaxID=28002 RepID=A0AA86NXP0_9EUKA|nr:internalin A [Hexamita inflata]
MQCSSYEKEITKLLSTQTKTHDELIKTYLNKIENGELKIQNNQELKELDLTSILHLKALTIENCSNIQKLQSKSVSKLLIIGAFQSLEDFQLENLEDLTLINIEEQNRIIIKEMNKFTKLKEIYIYGWTIYTCPLQITGLTKLNLISCGLQSAECLKQLVNLQELYLGNNKEMNDITSLQYLTRLSKLSLNSCSLINLDALRPLKQLEELNISDNIVVYVQPLAELKQLLTLYAYYNKIIDINAVMNHKQYNKFHFQEQTQPTQEQLKIANVMREIYCLSTILRKISQQSNNLHIRSIQFRYNIYACQQRQNDNQISFVTQVASIFNNMNTVEGVQ